MKNCFLNNVKRLNLYPVNGRYNFFLAVYERACCLGSLFAACCLFFVGMRMVQWIDAATAVNTEENELNSNKSNN